MNGINFVFDFNLNFDVILSCKTYYIGNPEERKQKQRFDIYGILQGISYTLYICRKLALLLSFALSFALSMLQSLKQKFMNFSKY